MITNPNPQVDEAASFERQLDLSLTRRLLISLNPDAVANPPTIPIQEDFERVFREIQAEQNHVGASLVEGLLKQTPPCLLEHPEGPKAIITVFRQCLPLVSKFLVPLDGLANEKAQGVLSVLKATL